jgi:hypothetical protein
MSRLHTGTPRDAHQRHRVERQHVVEIIVPKRLLKVKRTQPPPKGSGIGDFEQAPERLSSLLFGIQGARALLPEGSGPGLSLSYRAQRGVPSKRARASGAVGGRMGGYERGHFFLASPQ